LRYWKDSTAAEERASSGNDASAGCTTSAKRSVSEGGGRLVSSVSWNCEFLSGETTAPASASGSSALTATTRGSPRELVNEAAIWTERDATASARRA
jgi:hypothetical protein